MDTPYPSRKRLDHRGPLSIGTTDAVYLITIAATEHGTTELSDKADAILSAARYYQSAGKWFLHLFLIMPDHIHMLVHVPTIPVGRGVPDAPQPPQNENSFETGYGVPGGHALPSPTVTVGRGVPDAPQPPQNENSFETGYGVPGGHALPSPTVTVGRGVPDAPQPPPRGLAKTIGDFKAFLSKKHGIGFQANFFDTRIRDREHFAEKWNYICQNPVAKGLVPSAREWPHSIAFDPATGQERPHR